MRRLSKSVEVLVAEELHEGGAPRVHDAVVVGSGYGGAVSALRLAELGVRVLVLERGREYVSGEFPNDIGEAFGHVRLERNGAHAVNGYESGLYDLRVGENIGALVGNGLGGTSLINANVVMQPDPRVFDQQRDAQPAWPRALRRTARCGGGLRPSLAAAFEKARQALAPQAFRSTTAFRHEVPSEVPGEAPRIVTLHPAKRRRLEDLAKRIRTDDADVTVGMEDVDLAVDLEGDRQAPPVDRPPTYPCEHCGDCVSGCNRSSKKTLVYSYLPEAHCRGARLFTGVTVQRIERRLDGCWILHCVRTEARKLARDRIEAGAFQLVARHVVLAAGTFGSTEILQRSKHAGLPLSPALGEGLSTNGDTLAVGYLLRERVNGIGLGSQKPWDTGYGVGPTITGSIRIAHAKRVEEGMLIQDGAIPGAIAALFHETVTTVGAFAQLDTARFRDMPPDGTPSAHAVDWATLQPRGRSHSQLLLGIGHDPAAGRLRWDDANDRLHLAYDSDAIAAVHRRQDRYLRQVERQGGIFLPNPVAQPLPPGLTAVLSGPELRAGTFTVHPLGGCRMGADVQQGVVNHLGQVFDPDGGLHPGLFVLDGSIVPTALGANPLLTITALAERAMRVHARRIAARRRGPAANPTGLPAEPAEPEPQENAYARQVDVHFTEAMRSPAGGWQWRQGDALVAADAHLLLHLPIDDLELFGTDGRHVIAIPQQGGSPSRDRERLPARLRVDLPPADEAQLQRTTLADLRVESGWVSILPVPQVSRRAHADAWLRTALTWAIERGFDELVRLLREKAGWQQPAPGEREVPPLTRLRGFLQLCAHAAEARAMDYRLVLRDADATAAGIQGYVLQGRKEVGYAASWRALWRWLTQPRRSGGGRVLERTNVWQAFGELRCEVTSESGQAMGGGLLRLDMQDMTRMHAPQLARQRDTPNALVGLAGYPLWFLRVLVKTRLWDFRLPDSPWLQPPELDPDGIARPVPVQEVDTPWPRFPALRIHDHAGAEVRLVPAEPSVSLRVRRSRADAGRIELKLTRYRRAPQASPARGGMKQCRTLLMLNGFAQSTLGFVPQEHVRAKGSPADEPGLAEFFHELGYDVWLFDYRTSSILDASKLPSTMDDIAEFDIPAAVQHVLETLAKEVGEPAATLQLHAYAHCVGAASFAMSLLGGYLRHPDGRGQVASVTLSQMQMHLVGSRTAQMRLQVGGLLRDAFGIDYLRLAAIERQATAFESVLDRLFATLPVDPGEECPHERDRIAQRPGICTCKRMSGTISRLLRHDRIKEATHDRLPVYFGRANTTLLVHGGRCVENERLVNADGQNVYVTDANVEAHLAIPVALLHGRHNALFSVESARRTEQQLRRVHPDFAAAGLHLRIEAQDYAHFDCTIGYGPDFRTQILDPLAAFYQRAWDYQAGRLETKPPASEAPARSYAKAALAGPVLGWTRTAQDAQGRTRRYVRAWVEVDENESDTAVGVVTHLVNAPGDPPPRLWPVLRVPLQARAGVDVALLQPPSPPIGAGEPYVAIAVVDLELDPASDWARDAELRVFSLHRMHYQAAGPSTPPSPPATGATSRAQDGAVAAQAGRRQAAAEPALAVSALVATTAAAPTGAAGEVAAPSAVPAAGSVDDPAWRIEAAAEAARAAQEDGGAEEPPLELPPPLEAGEMDDAHRTGQRPMDWGTRKQVWQAALHSDASWTALASNARADLAAGAPPPRRASSRVLLPEQCHALWNTLVRELRAQQDRALQPRPGTLSRKHRQLATVDRDGPLVARLSPTLVKGSSLPGLSFLAASCRHPGLAFEDTRADASLERIAQVLHEQHPPAFMLMLGDQIYADATAGILDSPSPIEKIALRHRRAFTTSGFAAVTARLPTYMVIDDHEIDDNWTRDLLGGRGGPRAQALFDTARAAFSAYQWAHGPRNPDAEGFNFAWEEAGHRFLALDTRSWRIRYSSPPQVLHPTQVAAIGRWLDGFDARDPTPKFIVSGSVLAPGLAPFDSGLPQVPERSADSWQLAPHQRAQVLQMIADRRVANVVFVAGDYHCAAVAEIALPHELRAYALAAPPLYAQLPAANVKPWQVLAAETIQLPGGGHATVAASATEGDGFAAVRVLPLAHGQWLLELRLQVSRWAAKSPHPRAVGHSFVLR